MDVAAGELQHPERGGARQGVKPRGIAIIIWPAADTELFQLGRGRVGEDAAADPVVVFTNMSLGKVAVSFTHTIKGMDPFYVLPSVLLLGQTPSLLVLGSLVPVVGGVVLASLTEVSFNWIGFRSAMASNVTNLLRNAFSKELLADKEETLDDIISFQL